ncbi:MAG: tetratricopeptide repeat protein [Phycisphaerales bacterium]|nr:tetratricopeptide repeat protein [Phycisphaerales bacterium]
MTRASRLARTLCIATSLGLSCGVVAACKGPSSSGVEARKEAKARFDRVGAGVAMDQAAQSLESGQFSDALKHIDKVVAVLPDDPRARLLRGRIVLEMGRLESAAADFQSASALNPSCDECLYYLGVVFQRWGRDEEALAHYAAALAIEPTNSHYLLSEAESFLALGRVEEAKVLLDDAACHFEFSSALAHLRAEIAAAEGDDAQAMHFMELAVTLAADPSLYQEDVAVFAFKAREWDRCLNALATLPPSVASRNDLLRMRARCLVLSGRAKEARDLLVQYEIDSALRQEGITVEQDLTLGYCAWIAGDVLRAETCAARMIARNPTMCDGYLLKGLTLEHAGDLQGATVALAKACELDPSRKLARDLLMRAQAAKIAIDGIALTTSR